MSITLPAIGVLLGVPVSARDALATFGEFSVFPKGSIVLEQDAPATSLFIVVDGELMVTLHTPEELVPLGYVQEGETVGEMSFLEPIVDDGAKTSATVTANVQSKVWSISAEAFDAFLRAHPSAGTEILKALVRLISRRARKGNERLAD